MAYNDDAHFTISNIPFGVVSIAGGQPQIATRLHDNVFILPKLIALMAVKDEVIQTIQKVLVPECCDSPANQADNSQ